MIRKEVSRINREFADMHRAINDSQQEGMDWLNDETKPKHSVTTIAGIICLALGVLSLFMCNPLPAATPGETFLCSNEAFTNQDYTMMEVYKFVRSYDNACLTYDEVETIVRYCHVYKVNPVMVLTKMQMESDLLVRVAKNKSDKYLKNRAMGYGLFLNFRRDGLKFYKYGGFDIQVMKGIELLRKSYDAWRPGQKKTVTDLKRDVVPVNAASYALYVYTPFYGEHNVYGWKEGAIGNKAFHILYPKFLNKFNKVRSKG